MFNTDLIKLKSTRKVLLQDKKIERMQSILDNTPIVKSNEFHAAKIMFEKSIYNNNDTKNNSKLKMIYLAGILGLILGILYVMFLLAIQKRNNNISKSKK